MTFYRATNCSSCKMVEETLYEMAVVCQYVVLDDKKQLPDELKNRPRPLLVDEGRIIQGSKAILQRLSELAEFRKLWYKYQSDVCYCEDE